VAVADLEGNVWHRPPDADGLEARVEALLKFANGDDKDASEFIHPIIRAIVLTLWPLRTSNGTTAT
jgi:hypothetical protein